MGNTTNKILPKCYKHNEKKSFEPPNMMVENWVKHKIKNIQSDHQKKKNIVDKEFLTILKHISNYFFLLSSFPIFIHIWSKITRMHISFFFYIF